MTGSQGRHTLAHSFWVQFLVCEAIAVMLPALAFYYNINPSMVTFRPVANSMIGAAIATIFSLIFIRKVTAYPGVRAFGFVLPSLAATYAAVVTLFFALRIDYGRLYFFTSFLSATLVFYITNLLIERYIVPRFWIVPFGDAVDLVSIDNVTWEILAEPEVPHVRGAIIVADFRFDFPADWERMLAEAALKGHAVYYSKQLRESLTGHVSISHMSENSFGSLLPNLGYWKTKRFLDFIVALILIPILFIPFCVIALLIMLDSRGGAFFFQRRMGFRGRPFRMVKFRSMRPQAAVMDVDTARTSAITLLDDSRITRIGKFLRRSRLDELPQIFNVLSGEMSFIGPRPEAVELSQWYENELPFYIYRHIVRPGITGWAQVNQGHVADLDSVSEKLKYDFFYIKNFSSWLDALIIFKTLNIMVTGFGAK